MVSNAPLVDVTFIVVVVVRIQRAPSRCRVSLWMVGAHGFEEQTQFRQGAQSFRFRPLRPPHIRERPICVVGHRGTLESVRVDSSVVWFVDGGGAAGGGRGAPSMLAREKQKQLAPVRPPPPHVAANAAAARRRRAEGSSGPPSVASEPVARRAKEIASSWGGGGASGELQHLPPLRPRLFKSKLFPPPPDDGRAWWDRLDGRQRKPLR